MKATDIAAALASYVRTIRSGDTKNWEAFWGPIARMTRILIAARTRSFVSVFVSIRRLYKQRIL
jgi:hypothetical protein